MANLYNWRYKNLGDLKHVLDNEEFKLTNAGFLYNYQLINVPDFNGIGESTPSAYFYQVCFWGKFILKKKIFKEKKSESHYKRLL